MGIPSYFSHIIRNFSNIIRSSKYFNDNYYQFQHLFMDCNSIVYDAVHNNTFDGDIHKYENIIVDEVINRIDNYINMIRPTKTLYIAFDGVAPLAKMEQQRTRRHKTHFLSQLNFSDSQQTNIQKWNTSAITPGTNFMNLLSERINNGFNYVKEKYNIQQVIVSGSDQPGEGEHKLFDFLRKNDFKQDNIALYGLDSDLIMLSIFHMHYCNNIYNFREAPEFIKNSLPVDIQNSETNEPYFLDIQCLCENILLQMNCADNDIYRVYDYVFLCFFLGNDFLPHFPCMNIRTHGIDTLLTIYSKEIGKIPNNYLINKDNQNIVWKNVKKIIKCIANDEHKYIMEEYQSRKRFEKFKFAQTTPSEKETLFQNVPIIYRSQEQYISPEINFWESRYYKSLFHQQYTNKFIKDLCNNYLEGLEWVYKYYSSGCIDWRWKYNYHYPPLFKDLYQHIPHFETEFLTRNTEGPVHYLTQLSYVLPVSNHGLLPGDVQTFLKKFYSHNYEDKFHFEWAFCRYFWESHPKLPEINKSDLKRWDIYYSEHYKN
jgi:5'-3' exonuclease